MQEEFQDDEGKEYRWESGYEKTWEAIQEDESGYLEPSITEMIMKTKRKRLLERKADVRLGIMRHLYIILDLSFAMNEPDLKPTRQLCCLKILEDFIPEFHTQNPVSQLGIIITQNKIAKKISNLSNNVQKSLESVKKLKEMSCRGEPSVQNSLEVALSSLKHLPGHTSKEILIVYAALNTCDPGQIDATLNKVEEANVRVSFVGLAAELHICKRLCKQTGGSFYVALNDVHLKELIMENLEPPPASIKIEHSLIKVGFPHRVNVDAKPGLCMCHLDEMPAFNTDGYYCPQCSSKYCDLPAECRVCGLMLVTAPHLARSYRHLFPLKPFLEMPFNSSLESECTNCYGCNKTFQKITADKNVFKCPTCEEIFCFDCDIFLHDCEHSCPGCASNSVVVQNYGNRE